MAGGCGRRPYLQRPGMAGLRGGGGIMKQKSTYRVKILPPSGHGKEPHGGWDGFPHLVSFPTLKRTRQTYGHPNEPPFGAPGNGNIAWLTGRKARCPI